MNGIRLGERERERRIGGYIWFDAAASAEVPSVEKFLDWIIFGMPEGLLTSRGLDPCRT